ncbi:MAG: hypothetical protein KC643_30585 [Nitrospira sp.]|nr:hypothetical protein [Nitrospira sp.]
MEYAVLKANKGEVRIAKPSSLKFFKEMDMYIWHKTKLQVIILGKAHSDNVIDSDGWRGDNGLDEAAYGNHLRGNHRQDELVQCRMHRMDWESSKAMERPSRPFSSDPHKNL